MKARPILMNTPMVTALLDGRKSMTRRVAKPQPHEVDENGLWYSRMPSGGLSLGMGSVYKCPYGKVGDLLYVRESVDITDSGMGPCVGQEFAFFIKYKADDYEQWCYATKDTLPKTIGPKPSIHMSRWASRLTLEITDIRVERLQDISEEDAVAEGVEQLFTEEQKKKDALIACDDSWKNYLWHGHYGQHGGGNIKSDAWYYQYSSYKKTTDSFSSLWESINGKGSWTSNPWVWAISFRTHKINVDEFIKEQVA